MHTYKLVYFEDFLTDGPLNQADWNFQIGDKWHNRELQCYTNDISNCYIKDSKLIIKATIHDQEHCKYRSTRINTKDKRMWQYGKFEIKAKMPKGRGSWPALWLLGHNLSEENRWPLCGEIDLMEFAGHKPNTIFGSLHSGAYNHRKGTERTTTYHLDDPSDTFHVYGIIWDAHKIAFTIDDHVYASYKKGEKDTAYEWPFDQPFYLIINLAVGGMFGGVVHDEDLPYQLEIDWIKVYQQ
jgi:beta-glucanase (GH16 family)